ncbi:MAG: prephenate dehydratase [archaeon]
MKIAFLGPETTYTHSAAIKHFGAGADFVPLKTLDDVFASVELGKSDFGVVPVENSYEGSVTRTLDLFMDHNLKICAEVIIPVSHCIASNACNSSNACGQKKETITKIYSHSQALAQCAKYLSKNFPDAELFSESSTSAAAERASKEKGAAAISSELAAEKFSLKVLERNINDDKENRTRFFVIGKQLSKPSGRDKTMILFSTKNIPGALYKVLGVLAKKKVNMTKIESRPSKKKLWDVVFFVEFEGHAEEKRVVSALKLVGELCDLLKVLGSYPEKMTISD